ncbi:MAG: molybdopterin-dependent oxidoreductase [Eggerthellaceae bacterium]|nr:molybdopterin-dependent oxidoreductase [Eggerthellaceae bacterium]
MARPDKYQYVDHEKPWRYQEGDLTVTRTSAWSGPGCHLGCGILLYTDAEGKLVKVEGDPENPFNKGRLCPRCLDMIESVYNSDRILFPMRRVGGREARGTDNWERITWDEAYDEIAEKFLYYKEHFGAESVSFWKGTGRDIAPWISHLAWAFGSPNVVFGLSGCACFVPRIAASTCTSGSFWVGDYSQQFRDRYDDPRWKCPELIVLWGNNPVVSNSDGLYGHWVTDCMKRGSKIISVDPKMTWLGTKAELHLPLRPGTDAALAMGMLRVMIEEDIYDHEFVEYWCYGFEQLAETVEPYTLEKTEEITWVPAWKIEKAARMMAEADGWIMQWGVATDMCKEAIPSCQALSALFQITGDVDVPGGMISPPSILAYYNGWGGENLPPEQEDKRLGIHKYPLYKFGFKNASTDVTIAAIESGKDENGNDYPCKAAWLQTTNPLINSSPDTRRTYAALNSLEFIVSVDLYMTPTVQALADIVLPACTYAERNGIRIGDGVQRGETINKAVQVGECKSDMVINWELGKRIAPDCYPWETEEDMFSEILSGMGMSFEELRENAPTYLDFEYRKYEKGLLRADGQVGFQTQTGRIELWSTYFNQVGMEPVPNFEEPTPGPVADPDLYEEYPLILTTGARNWTLFHSEHRQVPRLRSYRPDPILQMHPESAEKYGIAEGDWVWVENHRGRAKRKVQFCEGLDPRYCSTDHGWWLPEAGKYKDGGFSGMWDFNINQLLAYDPGRSGFGSNYKTVLCRVYKCEEGDHNTPDNKFGYERPVDDVVASEPERIVNKSNVAADVLADATTVAYVAANEVKADSRLYAIDGGAWATRAREVEAEKVAERERAKEEFMAAYRAMIAEQEAAEAAANAEE